MLRQRYTIKELEELNCSAIIEWIELEIEFCNSDADLDDIVLSDLCLGDKDEDDEDENDIYMNIDFYHWCDYNENYFETQSFYRNINPRLFDSVLEELKQLEELEELEEL